MKKINYKYWCFVLTPFLISLFVYSIKGIHYSIVDDTLINYITEGVYGDGHNQYIILPYIGVIYTYIVYLLKSIFSDFNIYYIIMIISFILSFVCLNHLYYKKYGNCFFLLVTSCLQLILFNYFTYTVIAYLLCVTGILYLLETKKISEKIVGFTFVFFGIALRKDVFMSLLILFIPIIVYYIIKKDKKIMFCIISSIALFVFIEISNKIIINNYPITQNYIEWNKLSTKLRDYKPISYDMYKIELDEANISKNDLDCIYSWIFTEQETLGNKQLETIANQRKLTDTYNINPISLLEKFISNRDYMLFLLYAIIFLSLFKWKNYLGVSVFICTIADLFALIFRQRVVDRVYIPLMVGSLLIILLYYDRMFKEVRFKKSKKLFIFTIILFTLSTVFGYGFKEKKWYSKSNIYKTTDIYQYVHNNPHNLYVFEEFGGLVNAQYKINSVSVSMEKLNKNIMTLGNWDTFSERYYTQMRMFGIDNAQNFLANLDNYNNVYFILNKNSLKEVLIRKWHKEHLDKDIIFEEIDKVSNLSVMKVRCVNE